MLQFNDAEKIKGQGLGGPVWTPIQIIQHRNHPQQWKNGVARHGPKKHAMYFFND